MHLMAISQDMPQPSIIEFSLKITYVTFHSNLPEDNELNDWTIQMFSFREML